MNVIPNDPAMYAFMRLIHRSTEFNSSAPKVPASITETGWTVGTSTKVCCSTEIKVSEQRDNRHAFPCVLHYQQTRILEATDAFLWKWIFDFWYLTKFSVFFSWSVFVSLLQPSVHHGHPSVDLDHCRGPWLTHSTLSLCWQPIITTNIRR